jgi:chromosome segregation ATPase
MAEVTNELIYEVLKSIPQRMSSLESRMGSLEVEVDSMTDQLRGVNLTPSATNTDMANIHSVLDSVDSRIGRIERRLDLTESSVR